jgi:hypothetical protein
MCYIYILQDRTCSEVYDIGDNYINGYITTSTYDLPGYGTQTLCVVVIDPLLSPHPFHFCSIVAKDLYLKALKFKALPLQGKVNFAHIDQDEFHFCSNANRLYIEPI